MNSVYELYRAEQLPVFQNSMFSSPSAAQGCDKRDVALVRDLKTGLMHYDADYQNEQAVSLIRQSRVNTCLLLDSKFLP